MVDVEPPLKAIPCSLETPLESTGPCPLETNLDTAGSCPLEIPLSSTSLPNVRVDTLPDLLEVLRQQQREHEERISSMLSTHLKHVMDAIGDDGRSCCSDIENDNNECITPSDRPSKERPSTEAPRFSFVRAKSVDVGQGEERVSVTNALERLKNAANQSKTRARSFAEEWPETPRGCAKSIVTSRRFEALMTFFICLTAFAAGLQADWTFTNDGTPPPQYFRNIDVMLTLIFAMELLLRVIAEGRDFLAWHNDSLFWNIFDTFVNLLSAADEIITLTLASAGPSVGVFRILRMMRIVKVVRIVRVMRFFRDLRVMISGIMHSMKSLLWAMLLLVTIMYLVAVIVMQIAAEVDGARVLRSGSTFRRFFGSVITSVYSLYLSITGGISWVEVATPLYEVSDFLGNFFCVYVTFAVLCVLNIITGVFVENSTRLSQLDEDNIIMEELENRKRWLEQVRDLFQAADSDGNGTVSKQEFVELMKNYRVQALFHKLGLPVSEATAPNVFELIAALDGQDVIDLDEFVFGIEHVHGAARSIDVHKMRHENRAVLTEVMAVSRMLEELQRQHSRRSKERPSIRHRPSGLFTSGFNTVLENTSSEGLSTNGICDLQANHLDVDSEGLVVHPSCDVGGEFLSSKIIALQEKAFDSAPLFALQAAGDDFSPVTGDVVKL